MAGCGSSNFEEAKQINEEMTTSFEEVVVALESINSPEDVNSAAARIDQVTSNLRPIMEKVRDTKLTKSEIEQLEKLQHERLADLQTRMIAAAMKARSHSGDNPALGQAMERFHSLGQILSNE